MTKADQIRAMGDADAEQVARAVGARLKYVWFIRWKEKNKDRYDAVNRICNRRSYHRTKRLGGIGRWSAEHSALLKLYVLAGKSFSEIAKEMDVSRSTIAGKVKRLRDAGEIT